jgi:hypothetical protein
MTKNEVLNALKEQLAICHRAIRETANTSMHEKAELLSLAQAQQTILDTFRQVEMMPPCSFATKKPEIAVDVTFDAAKFQAELAGAIDAATIMEAVRKATVVQ